MNPDKRRALDSAIETFRAIPTSITEDRVAMIDALKVIVDDIVGRDPDTIPCLLDCVREAVLSTADHLESAWQDASAARAWRRIARAIDRAAGVFATSKPY